jgi:putative PIN family toxin of toxin-antitoxin system
MTLLVVVDTNVIVGGLLSHDEASPPARILDAMLAGSLHCVLSDQLLEEYRAVLLRPAIKARHGLTEPEVDVVLQGIVANAGWRRCGATTMHDDTHVVALLSAESAAIVVTGDAPLRESLARAGRTALTPAQFIAGPSA